MSSQLVEPGMKYFMNQTLKQCCNKKYTFYNQIYNISLGLGLFISFSLFLIYCYNEKRNVAKKRIHAQNSEYYLTNLVKNIQLEERRKKNEMITQLPTFEANQIVNNKIFL